MAKKQLQGKIVSEKMDKTAVVQVTRIKIHPKYKKRYRVYKKYKAHLPQEGYNLGDEVILEETRPFSKQKRWRIVKKIEKK